MFLRLILAFHLKKCDIIMFVYYRRNCLFKTLVYLQIVFSRCWPAHLHAHTFFTHAHAAQISLYLARETKENMPDSNPPMFVGVAETNDSLRATTFKLATRAQEEVPTAVDNRKL